MKVISWFRQYLNERICQSDKIKQIVDDLDQIGKKKLRKKKKENQQNRISLKI